LSRQGDDDGGGGGGEEEGEDRNGPQHRKERRETTKGREGGRRGEGEATDTGGHRGRGVIKVRLSQGDIRPQRALLFGRKDASDQEQRDPVLVYLDRVGYGSWDVAQHGYTLLGSAEALRSQQIIDIRDGIPQERWLGELRSER